MPAPANDNFASRLVISGASGSTSCTNVSATTEASEPHVPGDVAATIWFEWTAPATGNFSFVLGGPDYRFLAIYTGSSLAGLSEEASDFSPGGAGDDLNLEFAATSATVYKIQAGNYPGSSQQAMTLAWSGPPPNDNLIDAIALPGGAVGSADGSTINASLDSPYDPMGPDTFNADSTVWYALACPPGWDDTASVLTITVTDTSRPTSCRLTVLLFEATTYPPASLSDFTQLGVADVILTTTGTLTYSGPAPAGGVFRLGFGAEPAGDPTFQTDFSFSWSITNLTVSWAIEHYEHEFTAVVVGEPEIETNGVLVNTVAPENLHFVWQLAELGPSEVDYEISNTAEDVETSLGIVQWDFIRPYFHDFTLKRNGQEILAGPITSLNIEAGAEHVKIGGKDWMHYLERRCWPYDADLSYVNWPSGFRFKVTAAEIGQIVTDILETVRDVSGNFPGPPNDATFPSYSLKFTVDCDDTGTTRNYEISPFETSSVYDLIRSLSQMDTDDGGFDFYMTPARPPDVVFRLFYPESGDPDTPIFTIEVDDATAIANALEVGYTDSGPGASHVLGVGSGTATRSAGVNKHLRIVSARTRRLDVVGDYGDVKSLPTLESKTLAQLNRDWRSIHEIPILVDPADIPDFWTITTPGAYIMVNYDLKGHQLNSIQKIVSMDVTVNTEGDERVLLGLNQHVEGGSTDVASDP